jgi:hypothetical protein
VKWYLDPAYVTPDVDHFCLRAEIECAADNHANDCPYRVQSNVHHVEASASDGWHVGFHVANRGEKAIPIRVEVKHTLPREYRLTAADPRLLKGELRPGEERALTWKVEPPSRRPAGLWAPYDGAVEARLGVELDGDLLGRLSDVKVTVRRGAGRIPGRRLGVEGMLAGVARTRRQGQVSLTGRFRGELDPVTARLLGTFAGSASDEKGQTAAVRKVKVDGCLEPERTIEFTQLVDGRPVGGVTIAVKMKPLPRQLVPRKRR